MVKWPSLINKDPSVITLPAIIFLDGQWQSYIATHHKMEWSDVQNWLCWDRKLSGHYCTLPTITWNVITLHHRFFNFTKDDVTHLMSINDLRQKIWFHCVLIKHYKRFSLKIKFPNNAHKPCSWLWLPLLFESGKLHQPMALWNTKNLYFIKNVINCCFFCH